MEPRYPDIDGFSISNSSLETHLRCSALYWKRRTSKRRIVTVPMAIGTAVARAAQVDNEAKFHGTSHRLKTLVDHAVAAYTYEVSENEVQNASEFDIGASVDFAVEATRAYHREISGQIQRPLLIEEPIAATLGGEITLVGTPDCIEDGVVRDLKTGQPWTQRRADRSRQLTAYSLLYYARFERWPSRVAIDTVARPPKGKRIWNATTIWSSRCARDREALVETISRVKDAIMAGVALPAPEGAWWCSPGGCEQWTTCEVRPGA